MDVYGQRNTVSEVHTEAVPAGPQNPYGNAFVQVETPLRTELEAQQLIDPLSGRSWKISNPTATNGLGRPVAYRLAPGKNIVPFAQPGSAIVERATFMTKHLWVTPFDPAERYPAGDYPNQHAGGAGLPAWTRANRSIEDTDVVVWYVFGSHHVPRPEDWPVMPVVRTGFHLEPLGFFDRNPALDLPPPAHCH
jgi:primary-amine oxidase